MNDIPSLVSTLHPNRAGRPTAPARAARRYHRLAALRSIIAVWEERKRFRRDIARKLKEDPHLIDDIGLTRGQVEAEIAKPFWQA